MKKIQVLCVAALMCSTVLFGCQSTASSPAASQSTKAPDSATSTSAPDKSNANSTATSSNEDDKWNDMTDEELYELAKQEGGEITIYSISSRMPRTCEAFMEAYPELKAVATDFDQNEAI